MSCSCGTGSRAEPLCVPVVQVGGFPLPHTHGRVRSSGSSSGGAQPHGGWTLGWAALDSPTIQALPGRKMLKTLGAVGPALPGTQRGCRRVLGIFGILEVSGILEILGVLGVLEMLEVLRVLGILRMLGIPGMLGFWGYWECWGAPHSHLSEGGAVGVKLTNPSRTQRAAPLPKAPWGTSVAPVKMRM